VAFIALVKLGPLWGRAVINIGRGGKKLEIYVRSNFCVGVLPALGISHPTLPCIYHLFSCVLAHEKGKATLGPKFWGHGPVWSIIQTAHSY